VRAETHVRTDALLVPQRAVSELQGSFQLRVVGAGDKVSTKTVKVGDRIGSRWIIDEGLQPGTRVVVQGARTPDGTVVNPKPFTVSAEGQ
jgi:membrane fusion protein (multidrug efflux system)